MAYTEKHSDCVTAVGGEEIGTESANITQIVTAIKHNLSDLAKPFKVRGSPDEDYIHAMQSMVHFVAEMPVSLRRSAAGMAMCYSMYYDGSMGLEQCKVWMADLEQDMRAALIGLVES